MQDMETMEHIGKHNYRKLNMELSRVLINNGFRV